MAQTHQEFYESVIPLFSVFFPEAGEKLSREERMEGLNKLLDALNQRIDDLENQRVDDLEEVNGGEPEESLGSHRNPNPPEFTQLIGEVVTAAAWMEEAAGTILQTGDLVKNGWEHEKAVKGWAASGGQLLKALEGEIPDKLHSRMKNALDFRNFVVHGVFVGIPTRNPSSISKPYEMVAMKRDLKSKDIAKYQYVPMPLELLSSLAAEMWDIEDELEDIHSTLLGLK